MAIPTREQFDEAIDAIAMIRSTELIDDVRKLILDEEAILSLLKKHHEIISSKLERANGLYASKWLFSQQCGEEAADKYVKHCEKKNNGDRLGENEAVKRICRDSTTEYVQRRIKEYSYYDEEREKTKILTENEMKKIAINWLSWKLEQPRGKWLRGVLIALRNYHYTDRWENIIDEEKNKIEKLKAALNALDSLRSLKTDIIAPIHLGIGPKSFERMRLTIEAQIKVDVASIYPTERKDKKARERILAYDLYLNNKTEFGEAKPGIIHELMMLKGIENQVERRTLDGWLSKWRNAQNGYDKNIKELEDGIEKHLDRTFR